MMQQTGPVIHLRQLSKEFEGIHAVTDLTLKVFQGDVFGFLGPNGAGKSTTIRMMLSLIRPTRGTISIFGFPLLQNRNEILRRIGCIIEKPDFYLYLSAARNLELFGRLSGSTVPRSRIFELLELVGLLGREKDPVKAYSHGMKQRLGIAQTLLHDPELIILDEPTTGLDPQGIIDVRNLIRRLQRDFGKTVFLSSHQLNEVEQVATRMAIINKGQTVVQGTVNELLSSHELRVKVEVKDVSQAKNAVMESGWRDRLQETAPDAVYLQISKTEIPELVRFLTGCGIGISGVTYQRALEDYFLKITNGTS